MSNASLHSAPQFLFVPSLAALRRHIGREDLGAYAFPGQERLQTLGDVVLEREYREYLAAPALVHLRLDFFDQPTFLCVSDLRVQVRWA